MSASPTMETTARTAADISRALPLGSEAREWLRDTPQPIDFLRRLIETEHYVAAVRFMAHALRTRETVWWVCLVARHAGGDVLSPREREALRTAVRWVLEPDDQRQQEAGRAAEAVGDDAPAGCAAQAAAWCTNRDYTPSAAQIAAVGVLAAINQGKMKARVAYQQYVLLGLDVFDGTAHWATA